jgi:hypothetical protein
MLANPRTEVSPTSPMTLPLVYVSTSSHVSSCLYLPLLFNMNVAGKICTVHTVEAYRGSNNSTVMFHSIVQVQDNLWSKSWFRCHCSCQRATRSVGWTCNIFKDPVRTVQWTHSASVIKTNQLILHSERVTLKTIPKHKRSLKPKRSVF